MSASFSSDLRRIGIFAHGIVDFEQIDVAPRSQSSSDFEAGRAGLTVDEDPLECAHGREMSARKKTAYVSHSRRVRKAAARTDVQADAAPGVFDETPTPQRGSRGAAAESR